MQEQGINYTNVKQLEREEDIREYEEYEKDTIRR
jgi:hypothetical protein